MRRTALLLVLAVAGPRAAGPGDAVTGTVTYRERIALPPDAALEVSLEDISRADAPADVLGRATVQPAGQVPIRFSIPFDPSHVDPAHLYGVRARIVGDGRLLFSSTQAHLVLTRGAGRDVVVLVRSAAAQGERAPPALGGTTWTLVRLASGPVQAPAARRPFLVLDVAASRAAGSGGCNRFSGPFALDGRKLRFGKERAATLMACGEGMDLEAAFHGALGETATWRMSGAELEFLDAAGKVVAAFAARTGG